MSCASFSRWFHSRTVWHSRPPPRRLPVAGGCCLQTISSRLTFEFALSWETVAGAVAAAAVAAWDGAVVAVAADCAEGDGAAELSVWAMAAWPRIAPEQTKATSNARMCQFSFAFRERLDAVYR